MTDGPYNMFNAMNTFLIFVILVDGNSQYWEQVSENWMSAHSSQTQPIKSYDIANEREWLVFLDQN